VIDRLSLPGKISKTFFLGAWLLLTLFPLYWIVITSLKSPGTIYAYPLQYWPKELSLENFRGLFGDANFGIYMANSLVAATTTAAVVTLISLLSGYVIARFTFSGRGAVLSAFLVTQMIPAFIALGPLYTFMTRLRLVDSRGGLILVYVAMCIPFSTIMLRGFFENVPDSLEEAAMVDGCNRITALFRIVAPVMLPGITATFIFNFVNCWNELFLSVTLMNSDSHKTIPAALSGFITSYNIEWGPLSAAAVLTIVPTLLMFGFASKYIIEGLTAGAVKG
jgi:multiple sugar transport system permease protein